MNAARRPFGKGPDVSLFTLGTMRALESQDQMDAILCAAMEAGINHLETAPAYGPAEFFVGNALSRFSSEGQQPEGGWVITSKILPGLTLEEGQAKLLASLKRLGRDHLTNLAVHGLNREDHLRWACDGDGRQLLSWAVETGLVGQVGFSSHGSKALIAEAIGSGLFQFCNLHLHLLDPGLMGLATQALSQGMGVLAISPADKGGRLWDPSPTLRDDCAPVLPLRLAYRYLLTAGISTLTVGASRRDDLTLARQLAAATHPLTATERSALYRLHQRRRERLGALQCGQCKACLPCPNQVPIPALLRLRNLRLGHDLKAYTEERYNLIGRAGHWWEEHNASACQGCGDCLPRCPCGLPIPDLLAETHRLLASAPRRRLWG